MSSKQDLNGVRTAQDLERKWDLASLVGLKKAVEKSSIGLTKIENELQKYVIETIEDINKLKDQVDGNITTWFFNGLPTLENQPANEWITEEEKEKHIGDLYYDRDTGYCYRWLLEEGVYNWIKLIDSDTAEALACANASNDTKVDNKRNVFVIQPIPPYEVGDVWFKDNNELYRCKRTRLEGDIYSSSDWIIASKYTGEIEGLNAEAQISDFQTYVEKEYVTQVNFDKTTEGIEATVEKSLQALVTGDNNVFITEPIPPYNINDIYTKGSSIFVCTRSREQGELYNPSDWKLDSTYSMKAQFAIRDGVIESVVKQIGDRGQKTTSVTQDLDRIEGLISDVTDVTVTEESGTASLSFEGINASEPISISIHPLETDIAYFLVKKNWYVSEYMLVPYRLLLFTNVSTGETYTYELPGNLFAIGNTYDEFNLSYENRVCEITRRIGIDKDGEKYILDEVITEVYDYPELALTKGNYLISLVGYSNGYMKIRLMGENMYTNQFATRVEVNSAVTQTAESITSDVNKLIEGYSTTSEMNSAIDQKADIIKSSVASTYVSKEDNAVYKNEVSTKFEQTNSSFEMQFSGLKTRVDTNEKNIEENETERKKYIRFEDGNVDIGNVSNGTNLLLESNKISFEEDGKEQAYMSGNAFALNNLTIFQIGELGIVKKSNGSYSIKKVV